MKYVLDRNAFPQKPALRATDGNITVEEDHVTFERELIAHVIATFRSFNANWDLCVFDNYDNPFIGMTEAHAGLAAVVIRKVMKKASLPPKANWQSRETLHLFYRARLRRFRGRVIRIIEDRLEDRWEDAWILTVPEQLESGVASCEEHYVAHVRHRILVDNGTAGVPTTASEIQTSAGWLGMGKGQSKEAAKGMKHKVSLMKRGVQSSSHRFPMQSLVLLL